MAAPGIIESDGFMVAGGNIPGYRFTAADGLLETVMAVFINIAILGNSHFESDIISGRFFSSSTETGNDAPTKTFFRSDTAKTGYADLQLGEVYRNDAGYIRVKISSIYHLLYVETDRLNFFRRIL